MLPPGEGFWFWVSGFWLGKMARGHGFVQETGCVIRILQTSQFAQGREPVLA
jgi:hypothetical protein